MKRDFKRPLLKLLTAIVIILVLIPYSLSFPHKIMVTLFPLYKAVVSQHLISDARGFEFIQGDGYRIYYSSLNPESVEMIRDNTEMCMDSLRKLFNYVPQDRVNIIIYPELEEIADEAGLSMGGEAMGIYYAGTINILDPSGWIKDKSNMEEVFKREGPVAHELIHYMMDNKARGNIPPWFSEGVALYGEYKINGVEWAKNKKYEDYYTLKQMEDEFYSLDETKAYRQSFLIIKYIWDNFGEDSINEIASGLRTGKSLNQACTAVLNMGIDEIFENIF